jgi:superfamily I DNA/RNA helicase
MLVPASVSPVEGDFVADRQPTDAQRRVIGHRDGPLLVAGAAGSGRTEALARRLARLVADGVSPERVLVLARSRAGAGRLREPAS